MPDRRILIITYHFPPSTVAATFRPLRLARYLPDLGYKVWILTATHGSYPDGRIDNELIREIPSHVHVARIPNPNLLSYYEYRKSKRKREPKLFPEAKSSGGKRRSFRTFLAELSKFPDCDASWAFLSFLPALRLIYMNHIDVICTSGPPFGAHVLGLYLKKITRRPWIAQYGNPWTANPSVSWDFPVFKRMCDKFDLGIIRNADAITALDDILMDCIQNLGREHRLYLQTNGFDPAHFSPTSLPKGKFTITYAGSLYNMHNPEVIYQALNIIEREYPRQRYDMRIIFAGPPESDPMREGAPADIEFTGPLPHAEMVRKMNESHLLLDFLTADSDEKFSVSCKLYEYMAARRPVLAVTPECSLANDVRGLGLGEVVPCDDPVQVAHAILGFYSDYKAGRLHTPDNPAINAYSAPSLAREFANIVEDIIENNYGDDRPVTTGSIGRML